MFAATKCEIICKRKKKEKERKKAIDKVPTQIINHKKNILLPNYYYVILMTNTISIGYFVVTYYFINYIL